LGAYLFFRALGAGFWAAAFGAWAFPLCGFLILWANHPQSQVGIWLPWLLLATERALTRAKGFAFAGLAATTALVLVSGHAAVAAQMLIGSAVWAAARIAFVQERRAALAALASGWLLGVMLSAPQTLPTIEYLRSSLRVADRLSGSLETPPAGWSS